MNEELDKALENLKNAIMTKSPKVQGILTNWLNQWSKYIIKENTFKPANLPYYKRGDIVYVDFGFNVGAEYGGIHYAVIIEINNNKYNGNVLVIPLTSLDKDKSINDIPKTDIYIGDNIIEWTDSSTIAKPNQIRAISKMRIVKPVKKQDKKARLNREQMNKIEKRLKDILFYEKY